MEDFLEKVLRWSTAGLLGSFGGAAAFVYLAATKNRKFTIGLLVANAFVAFFVGKAVGFFIAEANPMRDGIIMVAGFFAYPILHVLEGRVVSFIENLSPPTP